MCFVRRRDNKTEAIETRPKTMMRARPRLQPINQAIRRQLQSNVRRADPHCGAECFSLFPPSANLLLRSRTSGDEYVNVDAWRRHPFGACQKSVSGDAASVPTNGW